MPEGALIIDRRDHELIWFNKSARRLVGLRYPQSLGSALTDVLPGEPVANWLATADTEETLNDVPSPVDSLPFYSLAFSLPKRLLSG